MTNKTKKRAKVISVAEEVRQETERLVSLANQAETKGKAGDIYTSIAYLNRIAGDKKAYLQAFDSAKASYSSAAQSDGREFEEYYARRISALGGDVSLPADSQNLVSQGLLDRIHYHEECLNLVRRGEAKGLARRIKKQDDEALDGRYSDAHGFGMRQALLKGIDDLINTDRCYWRENFDKCVQEQEKDIQELERLTGTTPTPKEIYKKMVECLRKKEPWQGEFNLAARQAKDWLALAPTNERKSIATRVPQKIVDEICFPLIRKFSERYALDDRLYTETPESIINRINEVMSLTGKKPSRTKVNLALKPLLKSMGCAGDFHSDFHSQDGLYRVYYKSKEVLMRAITKIQRATK